MQDDNSEYLSEAFDVFNRIAGLRSAKRVTGPALEKIFKKLERALDQYYDRAEEVLTTQLDMLEANLKTFQGSRFNNLPHVKELKSNFEQTRKSLAIAKKLKENFKNAKGKASDFQFNANTNGSLNIQGLEDAIKNALTNAETTTKKVEDDVKKMAASTDKKPVVSPANASPPVVPTVPATPPAAPVTSVISAKASEKSDADKAIDVQHAKLKSLASPTITQPQAHETPPVAPVTPTKPITNIKVDNDAQEKIKEILNKHASKITGLTEQMVLDEEKVNDIFNDDNLQKYNKLIAVLSNDQRKRLHSEIRKTLADSGYEVKEIKSGISKPVNQTSSGNVNVNANASASVSPTPPVPASIPSLPNPKIEPKIEPTVKAEPVKAESPALSAPIPPKAMPQSEVEKKPNVLKLEGTSKSPLLFVEKLPNNDAKLRLYRYNKDGTSEQGLIDKSKLGEYLRNKGYDLGAFNTWLVPQRQQM